MQTKGVVLFFLIISAFASTPLFANIDLYEFSNSENQTRYKALTKELRCPKCQNQDIADSNAPIAEDMRREVHRLLEAGEEDRTIVSFMVDRFGEFVSYKPKVKPSTYVLWYGPWGLLVFGLVVIVFMAGRRASKQNKRSPNEQAFSEEKAEHDQNSQDKNSKDALLEQHEQVEQLLSRFKDK